MKTLKIIRESLYGLLILVVSIGTIASFLRFSTDTAFFGTNTNITLIENNSKMSTADFNQKLEQLANQNDVLVAKRIYAQDGDRIKVKYALLGNHHNYLSGIPSDTITTNPTEVNANMMTEYAVYGPGDHDQIARYLHDHDITFMQSNPQDLKQNIISALGNLERHYLDKLLFSVISILVVINGFIVFRNTKKNALRRLINGKKIYQVMLVETWANLQFLVYFWISITLLTALGLWLFAPYIMVIALQCILTYDLYTLFWVSFGTAIAVLLFNTTKILAVLKGKVKGLVIPITSVLVMAVSFQLFTTTMVLSQDNQQQIERLHAGEQKWQQTAHFENILFSHLPNTNTNQGIKDNNQLNEAILNAFSEKNILFNSLPVWHGGSITLGNHGPNRQNVVANTTYFDYQKVKDANGKTIRPADFTSPVTILTTRPLSSQELMDNFAKPLGLTNLTHIQTRLIRPQEVYVYLEDYYKQDQANQTPDQIAVLNFDLAQTIDSRDFSKDIDGGSLNNMTSNITAWSSQSSLRYRINSAADRKRLISVNSQYIADTASPTKILYDLKTHAAIDQTVLHLTLALSLIVLLATGYFMTYIVMLAYRKKLFIQSLYGVPFLQRYVWIYGGFAVALLPGIITGVGHPGILPWIVATVIGLVIILSIQIKRNERQHYSILKGDL